MTISSPNKYLFVSFLGSYLHGTEMTSLRKRSLYLTLDYFFICYFVCLFFFLTLAKANQVLHCLLKN